MSSTVVHGEPGQLLRLARRWWRCRRYAFPFRGMARSNLPECIHWNDGTSRFETPGDLLFMADFVNVVVDDEYGLRALSRAPRTIVDIGANIGLFARYARSLFPSAIIHAYEPSPESAAFARRNTATDRTTVYVEGVAARAGRARMRELGTSNLAQTLADAAGDIPLVSFATVIERIGGRVDLLKIDCEGAEWEIMQDPALFANVDVIRMEYHLTAGRNLSDLEAMASNIRFRITDLFPNSGFGIAWLAKL